jgi:ABC-type polysaccharide/polyol phosphate export permease
MASLYSRDSLIAEGLTSLSFQNRLLDFLTRVRPWGIDVFCMGKKYLVYNLVARNLKVKYRRSILGIFWTLAHPLSMTAIYYFVFKVILKVQIPHYLVFMLSGILTWNFFASSVSEGLESLVGNIGLLTKIPIPIQIFPFVGTVTNMITWSFSLPILLASALLSGTGMGWSIVTLPFFIGLLFVMAYSLSVIMGIAFVYFRDLRHILTLILQAWFYATPVIYSAEMIPSKYQWVLFLNPVGKVFTAIHGLFVDGRWPTDGEWVMSTFWALALLFGALSTHKKLSGGLIENL